MPSENCRTRERTSDCEGEAVAGSGRDRRGWSERWEHRGRVALAWEPGWLWRRGTVASASRRSDEVGPVWFRASLVAKNTSEVPTPRAAEIDSRRQEDHTA